MVVDSVLWLGERGGQGWGDGAGGIRGEGLGGGGLGRGVVHADGRGLQLEGRGHGVAAGRLRRADGRLASLGRAVRVVRLAVVAREGRGARRLREPGCVGCRLRAQLREVQVCAGLVAGVHRLPQSVLAPEAVEDDAVDGDHNHLHHHLDDAADQRPVLQPADERVVHVVLEQLSSLVVLAAPPPQVLPVAVGFRSVQDPGPDDPHDDAKHEPPHGEHGVVDGHFLGTAVSAAAVGEDDYN